MPKRNEKNTKWIPRDGYRSRGRPKRRWRDDLDSFQVGWQDHALNRDELLKKGESFAQQWDTQTDFLLLITLRHCDGLSSIEMFDVFDELNLDVEPSANVSVSMRGDASYPCTESNNCTGSFITAEESPNNSSVKIPFNSTSDKLNNTDDIMNTGRLDSVLNRELYLYNTFEFNNNSTYNNSEIKTKVDQATEIPSNNNSVTVNVTKQQVSDDAAYKNGSGYALKTLNETAVANKTSDGYNKSATLPAFNIPALPFSCPEEEPPSNIGPYEVPTQRDVILHMRNHLLAMYHGFHTKAMHFLKDVKQATQASWSRKMFCRGPVELMHYRRCVRWVGDLSVLTTKSLVTAVETLRQDVATLIQGKICNISALTVDPIHLIRILAAEKVSLEFALPDFLRQLHACARYCPSTRRTIEDEYLKATHLTDQDFVIRHYLTQKNFNQQLKQQY